MSDRALSLLIWVQGIGLGMTIAAPFHSAFNWAGGAIVVVASFVLVVIGQRQ